MRTSRGCSIYMRLQAPVWRGLSMCCLALLFCACTQAPTRPQEDGDAIKRWPLPPDLPRYEYEATLRSPADLLPGKLKKELRNSLPGADRYFEPVLTKAGAIAARNGRIYVADAAQRSIVVFDVPRRKVFRFGQRHPGNVSKPVGVALDDHSNIYVADVSRRQVLVYDSLGLLLRTVGGPEDLVRPVGVAVDRSGHRIYVVDRGNNDNDSHRVVMFDGAGSKLAVIGGRGSGPGQFNVPLQAAVDRDGSLYVLDAGNFRVQVFDAAGRFLRAFGSVGSAGAHFARPRGLAVDDAGRIYVSDSYFGNVQLFDTQGQLLMAIGRSGERDSVGRYGLIAGVAVDETGRIYVGDQLFSKVEVFRPLAVPEPVAGP